MRVEVTCYPSAKCRGEIEVPDNCDNVDDYIDTHFSSIDFNEPELDFKNADLDYDIYR